MKPRSRTKHKGRKTSWTFVSVPHPVMDSLNWQRCTATAIKLLMELARQYNGRNNGDLSAAMGILGPRGWSSPETVTNAHRELQHYGLIELTRQGGLHGPSLYALTWYPIDDCGGKLDCSATRVASGAWKTPVVSRFKRPVKIRKPATPSVESATPFVSSDRKLALVATSSVPKVVYSAS